MKLFRDNRFNPFEWLGGWADLSVETRRLFATEVGTHLDLPPGVFSQEQQTELIDAGFLLPHRPVFEPTIRPFRNLVRSMYRHPFFNHENPTLDPGYIRDHLINQECASLLPGNCRHNPSELLAIQVGDPGWLKSFLEYENPAEWEYGVARSPGRMLEGSVGDLLKGVVEKLVAGQNPVPLSELAGNEAVAGPMLRAGARFMLLFFSLDEKTLDPMVGIWPGAHAFLNRGEAQAPESVATLPNGCEIYDTPLLLHDLTTFLVATSGEGLRLKATGELFKKEMETLRERMLPNPPFRSEGVVFGFHERQYEAFLWAEQFRFVSRKGKSGKNRRLCISKAGRDWLAASTAERLRTMMDAMRKKFQYAQKGKFPAYGEHLHFLPYNPVHWNSLTPSLESRIAEAFSVGSVGEWVDLSALARWQCEQENPFSESENSRVLKQIFGYWHIPTAEETEALWHRVITAFFYHRLLALGGARVASDGQGQVWFCLQPAGAYLLGLSDGFEYEEPTSAGDVLVQPNFEVIFTAPHPGAEGEFSRFAERAGHGVGLLFRITRTSVFEALGAGLSGDRILEKIETLCSKAPPKNVVAQIKDWTAGFRSVSFRRMQVIDCPDSATALRVRALFPKKTTPVTETLLEVSGSAKDLAAIKKKLRQNGLGIH